MFSQYARTIMATKYDFYSSPNLKRYELLRSGMSMTSSMSSGVTVSGLFIISLSALGDTWIQLSSVWQIRYRTPPSLYPASSAENFKESVPLSICTRFFKSLFHEIDFLTWFFSLFQTWFLLPCKNLVWNRQKIKLKTQAKKSSS